MKENDSRTTLEIIGLHILQSAARGDTSALQDHLLVYQAVVKASKKLATKGQG